ncbi:pentapeptide repeat-containing protein [Neorhizobium sp. DAR64861/K0K2]|uniref:pentapeptide repeat-containing protein n=1 Tax=unclassified Neorhizobium TaxID=2629175 RepID=UPI003D2CAD82
MINHRDLDVLRQLQSTRTTKFAELVRISGMAPETDFRGIDLRDVDFGDADLSGFDFTDADLSGANLSRANIRNAIFYRTGLNQAKMPVSRRQLIRRQRIEPWPFHEAVIKDVTRFSKKEGRIPSVLLSMPPGSGRHILMELLLEELDQLGRLKDVLVVTDNASGSQETIARLADTFGHGAVGEVRRTSKDKPRRIEIITRSALMMWLRDNEKSALRINKSINCILAITEKSPKERLSRSLREAFPDCSVISLDYLPIFGQRPSDDEFDLDFHYTYEHAASDGLLEVSKVLRAEGDVVEIVKDQSLDAYGVCIISEEENVEDTAHDIGYRLQRAGLNWRVIALQDAADLPDGVGTGAVLLVARPRLAVRLDWRALDFTIVTSTISEQLAMKIAFPPRRTNRSFGPVIFDFGGTVERVAAQRSR